MTMQHDPQRRRLLQALAASGAVVTTAGCQPDAQILSVADVSQLQRIPVKRLIRPTTTGQLQSALSQSTGPVSIGGARYSMGGQIASPGSLHLDLRGMRRLVWLDVAGQRVRVQAGMRWRDLQDQLDPHDLAVKIMQSYSNFSVGGSVAVNCHGRYVGAGPIAHSVRALQVVTAQGEVLELDRQIRPELFAAVIGGYGGLGVISEVELDLTGNDRIARHVEHVALAEYPAFFETRIKGNPRVVMHNADLIPPAFDQPLSISWLHSTDALTETRRLVPRGLDYGREQNLIWSASELPAGNQLRDRYMTRKLLDQPAVAMRNHEASLDATSLEPRTRLLSTYLLQEYFIPADAFLSFATQMTRVLQRHGPKVLNVSVRHSPADEVSLLKWAPAEVFCFVLYYKQRSSARADRESGRWARELIDAALAHGGRFYLPYRLHASAAQFRRAYPAIDQFAALKQQVDPARRFRNLLWDKYLPDSRP